MFTLGYGFRPWLGAKVLADGPSILAYVRETAAAYGVDEHIRYGRRVTQLSWDGATARWTATVDGPDGTETVTAGFVHACTGYYRYDEGYLPDFPGMDDFAGELIHPQHWPPDFDGAGKEVVVIGSGATAMTLVPALAGQVGHVTMLQRSPTYVASLPDTDRVADLLRRHLPPRLAHTLVKWKNVAMQAAFYWLSRRFPAVARRLLLAGVARALPDGFDVATHFTPDYDPWDQRLCLVPNDDLFLALRRGDASVVTDTTQRLVPEGVVTGSGTVLPADVVVTATGLQLLMLGGIELVVDGEVVDPATTVAYKGMMLSGVPNLAFTVGYTNASWTLKADLVSEYVVRLLDHLDSDDLDVVTPLPPPDPADTKPLIDLDAGYVRRSLHLLPRQGTRDPWSLHQHYRKDLRMFRSGSLDDEGVEFRRLVRGSG
jgi:cation diffusion facilitator CzcD-associated flavoprotein CzcO